MRGFTLSRLWWTKSTFLDIILCPSLCLGVWSGRISIFAVSFTNYAEWSIQYTGCWVEFYPTQLATLYRSRRRSGAGVCRAVTSSRTPPRSSSRSRPSWPPWPTASRDHAQISNDFSWDGVVWIWYLQGVSSQVWLSTPYLFLLYVHQS